jgi:lipid-binding SYLF domain-containing protein
MSTHLKFSLAGLMFVALVGCNSSPPPTPEAKRSLHDEARAAISRMEAKDPGVTNIIESNYGYAVFPSVGKGGLIAGGAFGKGEVYKQRQFIGYAELQQVTVGAQIGGEEYSELLVFQDAPALDRFTNGNVKFSANASAVALKAGAAKAARPENGVYIFVLPTGGLMAEASIGGQEFKFHPSSDAAGTPTTAPVTSHDMDHKM